MAEKSEYPNTCTLRNNLEVIFNINAIKKIINNSYLFLIFYWKLNRRYVIQRYASKPEMIIKNVRIMLVGLTSN